MLGFSCRTIIAAIIFCFPILGMAQKSPVSKGTPVCDELYRTGQYETALSCYQKALSEGADNPAIYLRLCKVYEALGEVDKIQLYLAKVDSASAEARDFLETLKAEYGTLNIRCSGQAKCPIYFVSRPSLNFIAPTELESGRAKRLLAINELCSKRSNIWFRKINPDEYVASIGYFPVVSGVPLPYTAEIADKQFEFNFNFMERGELLLSYRDLDSVYCGVPDSIAEVRISIDDPDFEAVILNNISGDDRTEFLDGRYYFKQGDKPTLTIQKKDRVLSGRKYFIVSSLVLTSAFILLQR